MSKGYQIIVLLLVGFGLLFSLQSSAFTRQSERLLRLVRESGGTTVDFEVASIPLTTPEGQQVDVANAGEDLIQLTFWAEWCSVCKTEMPALNAFARRYGASLSVLAVSIDQDPRVPHQYLSQSFPEGVHFDVLHDPQGVVAQQFGTTGVPETFIIKNGQVMAHWIGEVAFDSPIFAELTDALLSE